MTAAVENLEEGKADRRLEVMFIAPNLAGGGAERVITNLLRHVDRDRFRPVLVLATKGADTLRGRVPADVEIIDLNARRILTAIVPILRTVWTRRPHVTMSTLDHLNIMLGLLKPAWPPRCRLVLRLTDMGSLTRRGFRTLLRWSLPQADGLVFQSHEMATAFRASLDLKPSHGVIIHNPIDIAEIREASSAPVDTGYDAGKINLVAAGRLAPNKGFDLLLEALARLDDPSVNLTILGQGDELEALVAHRGRLGLDGRVRFAGFQPNPYPFFRAADGYVLSSRLEGFPNVVLEALACGSPVLATPVPGIPRLLSGIPSCVVAERIDAEALEEGLRILVAAKGVRPAEDVVNEFGVGRITRVYESYFTELLGDRPGVTA